MNITSRTTATGGIATVSALTADSAAAIQTHPMQLPPPRSEGGLPLMLALKLRRSSRAYSSRLLRLQTLSDLLWAAFGINRSSGDRTAPYWRHIMVIDIYVAMANGVWVYEPKAHVLHPHLPDDLRVHTGLQEFVATAPLNLIYVARGDQMSELTPSECRLYCSVDAAFIGQNVYLFCASEGLATVFRGAIDYPQLNQALKLSQGQFVTFAQSVGYPAD
jgi:nitroreductase